MNLQPYGISLEVVRPWMLWGLLLLAPIAWYFRRSLSDFPRWQRLVSLGFRSLIVVLLVLALAGLALLSPTARQYVVVAVDRSLSIDDTASERIDEFMRGLQADLGHNQSARFDFASAPNPIAKTPESAAPMTDEQRRGTDLAAAIEMAGAAIPPGFVPQIVLLTDGRQTSGDALQAAALSKPRISVVPLPVRTEPEVQVAEVACPPKSVKANRFTSKSRSTRITTMRALSTSTAVTCWSANRPNR